MCFNKKAEEPAVSNEEKDLPLKEDEIEEVSGGVKWGDGVRPTLKDAGKDKRERRQ